MSDLYDRLRASDQGRASRRYREGWDLAFGGEQPEPAELVDRVNAYEALKQCFHKCRRCGWEWVSRPQMREPKKCPRCKTVAWNREKLPNRGQQMAAERKARLAAEAAARPAGEALPGVTSGYLRVVVRPEPDFPAIKEKVIKGQAMTTKRRFLTAPDLAEMTGESLSTWRHRIRTRQIASVRLGRNVRIQATDFEKWVRDRVVPSDEEVLRAMTQATEGE